MIQQGDLVYVARPCCSVRLGFVFVVGGVCRFDCDVARCEYCGADLGVRHEFAFDDWKTGSHFYPVSWLRKFKPQDANTTCITGNNLFHLVS